MPEQKVNELLNKIVAEEESLQGIIVIDLVNSWIMYYNSSINEIDNDLFVKLIGDFGVSEAFANFKKINQIPIVLDEFGKYTNFGELEYSLFKLSHRQILVYFTYVEDLPILICYLSTSLASISSLITASEKNIDNIIKKLITKRPSKLHQT